VPKVRSTALILYVIYFTLTALEFIFLLFGKMPVFEALNVSFATAGTGGFAVTGDSLAGYSSYLQIVTTVFMFLFSINFASHYLILFGKIKEALNAEVRVFVGIVVTAITLITLNLWLTDYGYGLGETIKHSSFAVISIMSTTGFATENFGAWPHFSQMILVLLMFVGACAGSTGGGMKVSRHIILVKGGLREVGQLIHPKQVKKITVDGKIVEHEVVRSVNAYLVAFVLVFVVSLLLISIEGQTFETSFTSVATTMNNVGPGLGKIDTMGNFAFYTDFSKIVFIFDMLAGRLEIFPMLVLFAPATWRK
jgi:trk system potassium uptake protein TrkH